MVIVGGGDGWVVRKATVVVEGVVMITVVCNC